MVETVVAIMSRHENVQGNILESISRESGRLLSCSLSGQNWVTCTFLKPSKGIAMIRLDKAKSSPELHANGVHFFWIPLLGYMWQNKILLGRQKEGNRCWAGSQQSPPKGSPGPFSLHTNRCFLGILPKKNEFL